MYAIRSYYAYLGSINIVDSDNDYITIALLQEMVLNEGDAWEYMHKELHKVFSNLEGKKIKIDSLQSATLFQRLSSYNFV